MIIYGGRWNTNNAMLSSEKIKKNFVRRKSISIIANI